MTAIRLDSLTHESTAFPITIQRRRPRVAPRDTATLTIPVPFNGDIQKYWGTLDKQAMCQMERKETTTISITMAPYYIFITLSTMSLAFFVVSILLSFSIPAWPLNWLESLAGIIGTFGLAFTGWLSLKQRKI